MKAAIIDFNRTLFDPDEREFMEGALGMLDLLRSNGTKLALVSVCVANTAKWIKQISSIFDIVKIVEEKTVDVFQEIATELQIDSSEITVIGDRIPGEIEIGNKAGMRTIWLRQGKLANIVPITDEQVPNLVLSSIQELTSFLNQQSLTEDNT